MYYRIVNISNGVDPTKSNKSKECMTVSYYHLTYKFQSESTVYSLAECQGPLCSKQSRYIKFKWQQRNSNLQPLSS